MIECKLTAENVNIQLTFFESVNKQLKFTIKRKQTADVRTESVNIQLSFVIKCKQTAEKVNIQLTFLIESVNKQLNFQLKCKQTADV